MRTDGHLGPVSWKDPKTGTMLWMLAAIVALPTTAFVGLVVTLYVVWRTW